jgi:hypothetical protein
MDPPLAMARGRDGIIRDLYGRPAILVFNSKPSSSTRNKLEADVAPPLEGTQSDTQPLEFINVPGTAKENTATRTLIRTHVMRDCKRRKLMQRARVYKKHKMETVKHAVPENDYSVWMPFHSPQPGGSFDPFAAYPVQMQPYMYRLIHHCRYTRTFLTMCPPRLKFLC